MDFSPNRPVGLKTRMIISRTKVNASEKVAKPTWSMMTPRVRRIVSRPLIRLSQIPMMKAPMTAPGMEPMPPNTAATKAFRPGIPPEVGTTPG